MKGGTEKGQTKGQKPETLQVVVYLTFPLADQRDVNTHDGRARVSSPPSCFRTLIRLVIHYTRGRYNCSKVEWSSDLIIAHRKFSSPAISQKGNNKVSFVKVKKMSAQSSCEERECFCFFSALMQFHAIHIIAEWECDKWSRMCVIFSLYF